VTTTAAQIEQNLLNCGIRICLAAAAVLIAITCQAVEREGALAQGQPAAPFRRVGQLQGGSCIEVSPFSRDGSAFVLSYGDSVRVWDAKTLRPLSKPLQHPRLTLDYRLSGDGKTVLTAVDDEVRIWDVATSKMRCSVRVGNGRIFAVELSFDGTRFLTIPAGDDPASLWRIREDRPELLRPQPPLGIDLNCASFDPTGTYVSTHSIRRPYHVWDVATGREICAPIETDLASGGYHPAQFDPSGRRLLVPQDQGFIVVELPTGKTNFGVNFEGDVLTGRVAWSADGAKIAAVTYGGQVRVYDASNGKPERQFGSGYILCQIAVGGRWALCSPTNDDRAIVPELWDLTSGQKVQRFPVPFKRCLSGDFSPDGSTILISVEDDTTDVWQCLDASPPPKSR
jgi:WD40 repeat protein